MRGPTPIADEAKPPPLGNPENKDVRRERAYAMQPPTIPHKIDNYQVDLNVNACLACHRRGRAPRDAGGRGERHPLHGSRRQLPRRDVARGATSASSATSSQVDAKPLVDNSFEDVDEIVRRKAAKGAAKAPAKK